MNSALFIALLIGTSPNAMAQSDTTDITVRADDTLDVYQRNYNTAVNNYNLGVDLIIHLEPEAEPEELLKTQEKAKAYFRKALTHTEYCLSEKPNDPIMTEINKGARFALSIPKEGSAEKGSYGFRKVK